MNEIGLIKDQLEKAFYGGAWHGPSVMEVLENILTAPVLIWEYICL